MTKQQELEFLNGWLAELERASSTGFLMGGIRLILEQKRKFLLSELGKSS